VQQRLKQNDCSFGGWTDDERHRALLNSRAMEKVTMTMMTMTMTMTMSLMMW
jgi:hypothetical protein